jgi:hypothetical protein
MIERRIMLTLHADAKLILQDVYDLRNLKEWWMFLKDIEMENEDTYIAKFRVFMSFKFHMRRKIGLNKVVHEGVMKFPKAYFRFTVEVFPRRNGDVDISVKGEYSGPLERLAGTPMEVFLRKFAENLEDKYKGRSEGLNMRQILEYQIEASKDYDGEIMITVDECKVTLRKGKIVSAECGNIVGDEAIKKILSEEKPKIKIEYT